MAVQGLKGNGFPTEAIGDDRSVAFVLWFENDKSDAFTLLFSQKRKFFLLFKQLWD